MKEGSYIYIEIYWCIFFPSWFPFTEVKPFVNHEHTHRMIAIVLKKKKKSWQKEHKNQQM